MRSELTMWVEWACGLITGLYMRPVLDKLVGALRRKRNA